MDLVAIIDHDRIEGVFTIADRPDVIIACEVTGVFPDDDVRVHLGVLGINEPSMVSGSRKRKLLAVLPTHAVGLRFQRTGWLNNGA